MTTTLDGLRHKLVQKALKLPHLEKHYKGLPHPALHGAWDPEKHPRADHGHFTTVDHTVSIGQAQTREHVIPTYHLKSDKETFANAATYQTRRAEAEALITKGLSTAGLEALHAHHDTQLKENLSPDPVYNAAVLDAVRAEAERRGLVVDDHGKLQFKHDPTFELPNHQLIHADSGKYYAEAPTHAGTIKAAKPLLASLSDSDLADRYQKLDKAIQGHLGLFSEKASYAATLHAMHLEAYTRGKQFTAGGNLVDLPPETFGPNGKPVVKVHGYGPPSGVTIAGHEVPLSVYEKATFAHALSEKRLDLAGQAPDVLEQALGHAHSVLEHEAVGISKPLSYAVVAAHATIIAAHEEADKMGMHVSPDHKLHDPLSEKSKTPTTSGTQHVVPDQYLQHPKWEATLESWRKVTKNASVKDLEIELKHAYTTLGEGGPDSILMVNHARAVAAHEAAAAKGYTVGPDHKLYHAGMYHIGGEKPITPVEASVHVTPAHVLTHPVYKVGLETMSKDIATWSQAQIEENIPKARSLLAHASDKDVEAMGHAYLTVLHSEAFMRGMYIGTDDHLHSISKKPLSPPAAAAPIPEAHHEVPQNVLDHQYWGSALGKWTENLERSGQAELENTLSSAHTLLTGPLSDLAVVGQHAKIMAVHALAKTKGMYVGTDNALHPLSEHPLGAAALVFKAHHKVPDKYLALNGWKTAVASWSAKAEDMGAHDLGVLLQSGKQAIAHPLSTMDALVGHAKIVAVHAEAQKRGMYVGADNQLHTEGEQTSSTTAPAPGASPASGPSFVLPKPKPKTTNQGKNLTAKTAPSPDVPAAGKKLSQSQVRQIREDFHQKGVKAGELAAKHNVSPALIHNIVKYKLYREQFNHGDQVTIHHARQMRHDAEHSGKTVAQLVKETKLSPTAVSNIIKGKTHKEGGKGVGSKIGGYKQSGINTAYSDPVAPAGGKVKQPKEKPVTVPGLKPGELPPAKPGKTTLANLNAEWASAQEKIGAAMSIKPNYGGYYDEGEMIKNTQHEIAKRTNGVLTASEVAKYQTEWNGTPDYPRPQWAMQAVIEKFGLTGAQIDQHSPPKGTTEQEALWRTKARAFVDAQYSYVQEMLKKAGITEVQIYRGIRLGSNPPGGFADIKPGQKGTLVYNERALSSWSKRGSKAEEFGKDATNGYVMSAVIPAERIFSAGFFGMGTMYEHEFLAIGGDLHAHTENVGHGY